MESLREILRVRVVRTSLYILAVLLVISLVMYFLGTFVFERREPALKDPPMPLPYVETAYLETAGLYIHPLAVSFFFYEI